MKHLDRPQIYWIPLSRCPEPLSALCRVGTVQGKGKGASSGPELPQIFEKDLLEAAASLALKVSARTVVGRAGSLCQKVRAGAEEAHSLDGGGRQCSVPFWATQPPPDS